MKKIVTVGINPAYDYTLEVKDFSVDAVCRVQADYYQVAGKGADVAYYISKLGGDVSITGFLGVFNAEGFQKFYKKHDIRDESIVVDGHIRTNVIILSQNRGVTNLNSAGALNSAPHWNVLFSKLETLAITNDMFILAGSLCDDNPDDAYYQIIGKLKTMGKTVYLDTSSIALKHGVKALPDFIKPNLFEFCELMGVDTMSDDDIITNAIALHQSGIKFVCVSLGSDGVIVACKEGVYKAVPEKVENFVSTVGAGDAFVAGFAQAQAEGQSVADSIIQGCGLSRAVIKTLGPRIDSIGDVADGMKKVSLTKIT